MKAQKRIVVALPALCYVHRSCLSTLVSKSLSQVVTSVWVMFVIRVLGIFLLKILVITLMGWVDSSIQLVYIISW